MNYETELPALQGVDRYSFLLYLNTLQNIICFTRKKRND